MSSPSEQEWADEDFIPRDEPDPIELVRHYIRQRLLQGVTQRDVEDDLTGQGMDPTHAIELVSSVRSTGQFGELEVGTELRINGITAGFLMNPVYAKKWNLWKRQQRRQREASGETNEPNPALNFGPATTPAQELGRYLSHRRRRFLMVAGPIALAALVMYLLSR